MSELFFPVTGQRVVPLLKIDDTDEVTSVQTRQSKPGEHDPKIRIIRIAIGSIFKATVVHIDPNDGDLTRTKRQ